MSIDAVEATATPDLTGGGAPVSGSSAAAAPPHRAAVPAPAPRPEAVVPASPATGVFVAGWGSALPARRVTNADLEATLDTSDEWIATRTGIRERRWAIDGETTGPLATLAASRALRQAGLDAAAVDLVVVATCTPETPMPSTAAMVAGSLGAGAGAFDVNAACAGFPYALATASALLATGAAATAVVVGADTMSRVVDPHDRNTAVLFGDGAAAVALITRPVVVGRHEASVRSEASEHCDDAASGAAVASSNAGAGQPPHLGAVHNEADVPAPGLLAVDLCVDGAGTDLLHVPGGGARLPASHATVDGGLHTIRMNGRELFRQAVRTAAASIERTLARAARASSDVALFVPHQANARITDAVVARTGLSAERTWSNVDRFGNTSAASIPLALCEAAGAGALRDGDLLLLCGFGAGLTVGTVLWRWCSVQAEGGGA